MGIRFHCPNGHKLNVKSFLAGKRGICPDCGVKFYIPTTSGGQVEEFVKPPKKTSPSETAHPNFELHSEIQASLGTSAVVALPEPSQSPAAEVISTLPPPAPLSAPPPMGEASPFDDPKSQWYVRPPSGGQFGPAPAEVFKQWIQENRVSPDSFIWRDGWEEWKKASDVCPEMLGERGVGNALSSQFGGTNSPSAKIQTASSKSTATSTRRASRQKNNATKLWLTAGLLAVILVLVIVLAVVLKK